MHKYFNTTGNPNNPHQPLNISTNVLLVEFILPNTSTNWIQIVNIQAITLQYIINICYKITTVKHSICYWQYLILYSLTVLNNKNQIKIDNPFEIKSFYLPNTN